MNDTTPNKSTQSTNSASCCTPVSSIRKNTSTIVASPPSTLDDIYRILSIDLDMFVNEKAFFEGLNEIPTSYTGKNSPRGTWRVPNTRTNMRKIRTNVISMLEIYGKCSDYFSLPTSNRSKMESDLCRYIYTQSRADSRIRKEMTERMYPTIWPYCKNLPVDTKVYVLPQ